MKRLLLIPLLSLLVVSGAWADGGMWPLWMLSTQEAQMKQMGLNLDEIDIYNPNGSSLKDAVVLFDGGCSGVLVSDQGLLLTNHHCGYDQIQAHSSVGANWLEKGFMSLTMAEELPNPGLEVEIVDEIRDVTAEVNKLLAKRKPITGMEFLSAGYLTDRLAPEIVGKKAAARPGYKYEIKAFYGGNKYYMFTKKVFRDVRLVAAPPSSIGKFGADTDNWMWPRHTGDFSIFRIYADREGNPVPYSKTNVPYKPKRWVQVTAQGVAPEGFVFIMGYPGTTYQYFTPDEVTEWGEIDNNIRIEMRGIRQEVMLGEMLRDEATNIKYAAKYASSQNGYKRAQGANWAIKNRKLADLKRAQHEEMLRLEAAKGDAQGKNAAEVISRSIAARKSLQIRKQYLLEGILYGIECSLAPLPKAELLDNWDNAAKRSEGLEDLRKQFELFFDKDYDPAVDRKIAKALLTRYAERIAPNEQPQAVRDGIAQYGSAEAYIDKLFDTSIFASKERFEAFMKAPERDLLANDPMVQFGRSCRIEFRTLNEKLQAYDAPLAKARKEYIAARMANPPFGKQPWPDANLTLRFTYGQIKGYKPHDAVLYGERTTLDGVMEKEDPHNWEYVVDERLKKVYEAKDYAPYAFTDGRMPVDFCATTHTTGGNSGSPVFNGKGELVGLNFDRNWEGVGGDIEYLPDYQRSIILDIRYLLLVVDKVLGGERLIREMNPIH